jgi:hypothetical protein
MSISAFSTRQQGWPSLELLGLDLSEQGQIRESVL